MEFCSLLVNCSSVTMTNQSSYLLELILSEQRTHPGGVTSLLHSTQCSATGLNMHPLSVAHVYKLEEIRTPEQVSTSMGTSGRMYVTKCRQCNLAAHAWQHCTRALDQAACCGSGVEIFIHHMFVDSSDSDSWLVLFAYVINWIQKVRIINGQKSWKNPNGHVKAFQESTKHGNDSHMFPWITSANSQNITNAWLLK